MYIEHGPSLEVLVRDLDRRRLKIDIEKYNIYLGYPEANETATQSLSPEDLMYNIYIDNDFLPKDFCNLIKDEDLKLKVLKQKGLVDLRVGLAYKT